MTNGYGFVIKYEHCTVSNLCAPNSETRDEWLLKSMVDNIERREYFGNIVSIWVGETVKDENGMMVRKD